MGITQSLSGVIGKSKSEVVDALGEHLKTKAGGIEPIEINDINEFTNHSSVLMEGTNGITIYYPFGFVDWDEASMCLSEILECPVFTFHIDNGKSWLYVLYNNGKIIDEFNPRPEDWFEDISKKEIEQFAGNPELISQIIESVDVKNISNYFLHWDLDAEPMKAYPEDKFENNGLQLADFMKKIGLECPIEDADYLKGDIYEIWTTGWMRRKNQKTNLKKKPRWKFW